jgi:hypothetical protein
LVVALLCMAHVTPAAAASRSALVMVSARVVESCRVEAISSPSSAEVALEMRCNSKARPALTLASKAMTLAPVGSVSVPHRDLADGENGKTVNIEF